MSMNKTCPISNFSCDEDPEGMSSNFRTQDLTNLPRSFIEAQFFQQRLKALLGTQAVVNRIDFKIPTGNILILIGFLQPIQGCTLFAQPNINGDQRRGRDVALFRQLVQMSENLLSFSVISQDAIRVAQT